MEIARDDLASGRLFVALGPRGVGKTQMAVHLARQWCFDRGVPALYRRLADAFTEIRATYTPGALSTEARVLERMERAGLLVLDECHDTMGSDFESRVLNRLLDARYAAKRATLLLSNQTVEEFERTIGPSIADRLCERGRIVIMDWPSFRKSTASVVQVID